MQRPHGRQVGGGHRVQVGRAIRRQWVLFAVAGFAWVVEMALGVFLWSQLRGLRLPPEGRTSLWLTLLGVVASAQTAGAWLWRRRMLRSARVADHLARAWRQAGYALPVPEEISTVAAIRTVFVADAVTWMMHQTIAIYGLVAMIVLIRLWPLVVFGCAALGLLASAAPRQRRMLTLLAALVGEVGAGDATADDVKAGDVAATR